MWLVHTATLARRCRRGRPHHHALLECQSLAGWAKACRPAAQAPTFPVGLPCNCAGAAAGRKRRAGACGVVLYRHRADTHQVPHRLVRLFRYRPRQLAGPQQPRSAVESRRLVLNQSPGRRGISEGATTSQSSPALGSACTTRIPSGRLRRSSAPLRSARPAAAPACPSHRAHCRIAEAATSPFRSPSATATVFRALAGSIPTNASPCLFIARPPASSTVRPRRGALLSPA